MIQVEIFTQDFCGYCTKAKQLIQRKINEGMFASIEEYNIMNNSEYKKDLKERLPEAKTVPQIFLNGLAIGGHENLIDYIEDHTGVW